MTVRDTLAPVVAPLASLTLDALEARVAAGVTSMARTTGFPAVAMAGIVGEGAIGAGVWPPESLSGAVAERVLVEGYPMPELQPLTPGDLLGPAILDGRTRVWLAHVDGEPAAVAAAHLYAGVTLVEYVAALPRAGRNAGRNADRRIQRFAPVGPSRRTVWYLDAHPAGQPLCVQDRRKSLPQRDDVPGIEHRHRGR